MLPGAQRLVVLGTPVQPLIEALAARGDELKGRLGFLLGQILDSLAQLFLGGVEKRLCCSEASRHALGGDQRGEIVERGFGWGCLGWLADVIGCAWWVQVVGGLGVPVGVELVAKTGVAGLRVVGVAVKVEALALLGVGYRVH